MDRIAIRNANLADADAIAPLLGQLGHPSSPEQTRSRLREMLADARHAVFVAERAGRVLACAAVERRFSLHDGAHAELMTLVVDASAQRAGIGLQLLQSVERWAREQGFAELWVGSNVRRAESHPFYLKHGFALRKSRHFYAKPL